MRKNTIHNMLKTTSVRKAWAVVFVVAGTMLTATSCADDDAPSAPLQTVQLLVSVPAQTLSASQHRLGDPGTAVPERADWDCLTVIMAYTDDSQVEKKVLTTTLSKEDFEKLPTYSGNIKLLTIDAQLGTVYIYGVTYSKDAANGPADAIEKCQNNAAVQALTISNDYASANGVVDYAKFVSVATGYYKGTDGTNTQPAEFIIQEGGTGAAGTIPTMTLTRLATKIDVQWDVADAYDKGYTDMKLTDFSLTGTTSGYLFPAISGHKALTLSDPPVTFTNTTPISQRNGRQYHYTFTDGMTVPTITFHLSGKQDGTKDVSNDYKLSFQLPLQPATWYRVNATVKGITPTNADPITISIFKQ